MRTGMTDLLPCPFCGGEGNLMRVYGIDGFAFVKCLKCGAICETKKGDAEAIEAWNTRAERTCKNVTNGEMFECSECAMTLYLRNEEAGYLNYENGDVLYCPNCGAKVVGD